MFHVRRLGVGFRFSIIYLVYASLLHDHVFTMVNVVYFQVPDVNLSAPDVPSGDVDVSVSAPDMPSGDVDASVSVPDMPSVDAKVPKKTLFGKFLKKKPSKGGLDVSDSSAWSVVPDCCQSF